MMMDTLLPEPETPRPKFWRGTVQRSSPLEIKRDDGTILYEPPENFAGYLAEGDRVFGATINTRSVVFGRSGNPGGQVVEQDLSAARGYVRFADGRQEAWVTISATLGGTKWTDTMYYSDHSMGAWAKNFSRVDRWFASASPSQYWATANGPSNSSAGKVRAFRPNSGTNSGGTVSIHAYGMWS